MKKLMILIVAVAAVASAKAATIAWGMTATAAEENYSVFLFTSAVADKYDTYADLISGNFDSASVTKVSGRGGSVSYKIADNSGASDSLGNTLYVVLVSGSDATTYKYGSVDVSAYTYNPDNQETSPGTLALTTANFSSSGTIGAVPEPTSGLLMLLGMAGLALRRKRA